jgi:hypothetical protein
MEDSINLFKDSVATSLTLVEGLFTSATYPWMILAAIELLCIMFLLAKLREFREKILALNEDSKPLFSAKKSTVDMNDLMNNINGARDLYKQLSRVCHPDRFADADKNAIATDIFQELSKHRRNYKKMLELKQRIINELNLKID